MNQREIKFRAWDKTQTKMLSEVTVTPKQNVLVFGGWIKVGGMGGQRRDLFEQPSSIPMQYTGLKDKNGKEIYEGDIVKRNNNGEGYSDAWSEKLYTVGWDSKEARFVLMEDAHWGLIWRMEVIGNIYENPELLTK